MTKVWNGSAWTGPGTGLSLPANRGSWEQVDLTMEPTVDGVQEFRRRYAKELRGWYSALADRSSRPANIWFVGDSVLEGLGQSSPYKTAIQIFRDAIQRMYRNGGYGYVPAIRGVTAGWTWPVTADSKFQWSYTGTTPEDATNYNGLGRRAVNMANTSTATITIDADRFWILYMQGPSQGSFSITIDGVAAPNSPVNANNTRTMGSRIYDSGAIADGANGRTHTVVITSTTANTTGLEGIYCFNTDYSSGVHIFDCTHSGQGTKEYDGQSTSPNSSRWAELAYQPDSRQTYTDGVGNGTTTFTSATATFSALDVGAILWPEDPTKMPANTKITAFTNSTTVTLNNIVPANTGIVFHTGRAQVATGSFTINSRTVNFGAAVLGAADVGKTLVATHVFPGAKVANILTTATADMTYPAWNTSSSQFIRVQNRQSVYMTEPDLLILELGLNDAFSYSPPRTVAEVKQGLINTVTTLQSRGGMEKAPSVLLTPMWAPGGARNHAVAVANVSGNAVVTSTTALFDPADVGKSISGTGVAGGATILSYQSPTQVTMSAVSTSAITVMTIATREMREALWLPYREMMYELSEEQGWAIFDMHSMSGFYGTLDASDNVYDLDPYSFSIGDEVHPRDAGAQWLADRLNDILTGMPRNASIPQGIFDYKGQIIASTAADVAVAVGPGVDGQSLKAAPGNSAGLIFADSGIEQRIMQGHADPGNAAFTYTGFRTAATAQTPSLTSGVAASNVDSANAPAVRIGNNVSGTAAFLASAAFTIFRTTWQPEFGFYGSPNLAVATLARYWIGLSSSSLGAISSPTTTHVAAFRYSTDVDGTAFWRFVTCNGASGVTTTTTNVAFGSSLWYDIRIEFIGIRGSAPTAIQAWINDVMVAKHTTNLPASVGSNNLGINMSVTPLTAATKSLDIARFAITY